jgi:hypothetical protein
MWSAQGVVDLGLFSDWGGVTCDSTGSTQRCTCNVLWLYALTASHGGRSHPRTGPGRNQRLALAGLPPVNGPWAVAFNGEMVKQDFKAIQSGEVERLVEGNRQQP